MRRARGSCDSCPRASVTSSASAPTGTFTKKIQRHDRPLVIAPPSTGPTATAMPVMAPKMPKAVPRSRPVNALDRSASEVANMIAPPTPCAARARARKVGPPATPHSSEPPVNTTLPTANTTRRAGRSGTGPAVRSSAASVSAYASTTHCRSDSDACRDFWMSGSATFTIVTSSRSMKTPVQTATSVHHLRSMGSLLGRGKAAGPHVTLPSIDRQVVDDLYVHDQPMNTLAAGMPPISLIDHTGYLLRIAYDHAHRIAATELPDGPHPRDFSLLVALQATGPISQQQLAEKMRVNRTLVVGIVDDLE